MRPTLLAVAIALVSTVVPAQLSGNYTVDPNGTGSRNFTSLRAISTTLVGKGVAGPVAVSIADGTYAEDWALAPIPGTSAKNTVTFRAANKHKVILRGQSSSTAYRALQLLWGVDHKPNQWLIFDGLDFAGQVYGLLNTSVAARGNANIVFRNCLLSRGQSSLLGISMYGYRITVDGCEGSGTNTGRVFLRGEEHVVRNCRLNAGISITGDYTTGRSAARVYNNLLTGGTPLSLTNAQDSIAAHNTVIGGSITLRAHWLRPVKFFGNLVSVTSGGYGMSVGQVGDVISDGNLFELQTGARALARIVNISYTSLSAWQAVSKQDKNSLTGDPKFKDSTSADYHLLSTSPAIDKAVGTPTFVTTDLDGQPRGLKPDIGCYELFRPFETFGVGCAGTLGNVPRLASTGSPVLGSKDFALTLSNALGGAKAFVAVGISDRNWGGIKLPINFGGSCNLLVSADFLFQLSAGGSGPGNGTASVKLAIPNSPQLKGKTFFAQWAVVDKGAAAGLAFSNAGRLSL